MARWTGVDLDGTLAEYQGHMGTDIGEPINAMVRRVKGWLNDGKEVRIFTARASDSAHHRAVRAWLKKHGLDECGITNAKDFDMLELWDDKARRVEKNKGVLCKGCKRAALTQSSPANSNFRVGKALAWEETDC